MGDNSAVHCSCGEHLGDWVDLEDGFELDAHGSSFTQHLEAAGEPGTIGHQLEVHHEGDGWNEPMHESLSCTCRLEIGSWTQKDPNSIDYPAWTTFLAGPAGVVFAHHLVDVRDRVAALEELREQARSFVDLSPAIQRLDQLGPLLPGFLDYTVRITLPENE